jgi:hypothetical protein
MEFIKLYFLSEWSVPVWVLCTSFIVIIFDPAWEAIHYGQITPLITGILSVGMVPCRYSDVVKGIAVGIVGSLKPTLFMLAPFAGIAYGWRCILSMSVTSLILLFLIPSYMIEYLKVIRFLTEEREFAGTFLVNLLGFQNAVIFGSVVSLFISLIFRGRAWVYPVLIGITTVCTALWRHSLCVAIIPLIYFLMKVVRLFERHNIPFCLYRSVYRG